MASEGVVATLEEGWRALAQVDAPKAVIGVGLLGRMPMPTRGADASRTLLATPFLQAGRRRPRRVAHAR